MRGGLARFVRARYIVEGVSQQTRRLLLVLTGLAGIEAGLWEASQLARDIIDEAQGKCDYLSCTNSWTLPSLAGALVLVTAGAALVTWSVFLGRRHPADAAAKEHPDPT
jgi:hypothetical protein